MEPTERKQHEIKEFQTNSRLEAFSDGVFAIVITLLVLELTIPELRNHDSKQELFEALYSIRNKLLSYALCFLFVGQLWISHSNLFRIVRKTDINLFWLNNFLLMCVCLFPFVAGIIGDYPRNPGAMMVFGILYSVTGVAFCAMAIYCSVKKFLTNALPEERLKKGSIYMISMMTLSVIPVFIAEYNPAMALACYFLLTVGYIFGQKFFVLKEK